MCFFQAFVVFQRIFSMYSFYQAHCWCVIQKLCKLVLIISIEVDHSNQAGDGGVTSGLGLKETLALAITTSSQCHSS